jgi:hypothetical protein
MLSFRHSGMRRSRSPASSYCNASERDSSHWDVWAFRVKPRLRSGMPCLGLEFSTAQKGPSLLVTAICTKAGSANSRLSVFRRARVPSSSPHKAAVARDIRGENSGQPTCDAFRGQSGAPQPHGPNESSVPGSILKANGRAGIPFRRGGSSGFLLPSRAVRTASPGLPRSTACREAAAAHYPHPPRASGARPPLPHCGRGGTPARCTTEPWSRAASTRVYRRGNAAQGSGSVRESQVRTGLPAGGSRISNFSSSSGSVPLRAGGAVRGNHMARSNGDSPWRDQ